MTDKFYSMRNMKFLLFDVNDVESLTRIEYFQDHSRETFEMTLDIGDKLARGLLWPLLAEMDRVQPEYEDGKVRVNPQIRTLMKECGEGGWIGAYAPYELDGQQLPVTVLTAFRYILSAANYSAGVFPALTGGAAHLIISFGSQELIDNFVPPMFKGAWQGTMALTEPQAGSSLTDVATTAFPTEHGYYKIRGQKIFISAGEHDAVDNVVHLVLARIAGAPPGIKGLSLFVIPKRRLTEDGGLEDNDVACAGIFHKLGYRGAPITHLAFGESDDCRGWLVGEPNKGLSYMFQMMNDARIGVGAGATAIGSAAYYASLAYTLERPQGRPLEGKDPTEPQVPIIEHADVKRMLLFQRAVVEGSLSLLLYCAKLVDIGNVTKGDEKEDAELLAEILTPVCKSYPSEMCVQSCSQALQCLGGYGYCDEFPLEQYYRDARIHPIHEGTTGIQGMDLLGRKVMMKKGRAYSLYLGKVRETIEEARSDESLSPPADALEEALRTVEEVTAYLISVAKSRGATWFLADATLYLELFGIVAIAWQWLRQAISAQKALTQNPSEAALNFYNGKILTCRYFFEYELVKIEGLARRLKKSDGLTVEMIPNLFED